MDVGDKVTRLIGGIMPEQVEVTGFNNRLGIVYCGDVKFDIETGMEMNDDKEWGPEYEKTGSYLKEILDELRSTRKHQRAVAALVEARKAEENEG